MTRTLRLLLDIFAVLALTALSAYAVHAAIPLARVVGTALLVLFLPGYALSVAFFPRARSDTDPSPSGRTGMERLGLTTALSLALVGLTALVANFTPYGVTQKPILAGVVALTGVSVLIGAGRRLRLAPAERYVPSLPLSTVFFTSGARWQSDSRTAVYNVALVASLLCIVGSAGLAVAIGPNTAEFTEFSVEMNGQTPEEAAVLEPGESPTVVVENHEGETHDYTAVVVEERVEEGPNGSVRTTGQQRLATDQLSVAAGERSRTTFDVSPPRGESVQVSVLLYKGDPPENPSRQTAYRVLTFKTS